jgi:hypothetical protein
MGDPRAGRLVGTVLRCYPPRWRRRHGEEAAELAALLIRDGTPAGRVAWSYLAGAAREWLSPRPGRHRAAAACALLVAAGSLGISAGLLASAKPARAAGTSQAPAAARCRPAWPGTVPGAVPGPGRPPLILRGAGRGRTC